MSCLSVLSRIKSSSIYQESNLVPGLPANKVPWSKVIGSQSAMAHFTAYLAIWGLETYWSAQGSRFAHLVLHHFLKGRGASSVKSHKFAVSSAAVELRRPFGLRQHTARYFFLRLRITNYILEPAMVFIVSTTNGEDRSSYRRYST